MEHNRLGLMGHYYGGMLDIYSDLTLQCATFGGHIELLEVDELAALRRDVPDAAIEERVAALLRHIRRAARLSARGTAPRRAHFGGARSAGGKARARIDGLLLPGTGIPENEDAISSIILGTSLLTARGIPVAGEYEVKNAQAMKIMDAFGAGGSFTEYYATDFKDDVVLMGHDGPGHMRHRRGQDQGAPARRVPRQSGPRASPSRCR